MPLPSLSPSDIAPRIRLLVADDHALFRTGLSSLLREHPRFEVVAEAVDGASALEATKAHAPDVVLLDVSMPVVSGLEAARRIRKAAPATRILMLSVSGEESHVARAIEAGCTGYFLKDARATELFAAIELVAAGKRAFSPEILEVVVRGFMFASRAAEPVGGSRSSAAGSTAQAALSHRELEVLQLIASGKSSRVIAGELQLSSKTVDTHRANLMRKLGIHGVAELVRWAVTSGVVAV